ncbi:phosphatidylinositol 4-phosphate 5-kinase 8 [Cynara cardunculus var. scolymus]|uniref:phosphatidylinositol 4-phosphate 5-kinase 8 n=1 Tax=Cynara cardunculus var. scolymus TaxID=59895 RepID=UPI000D62FD75|nr:phosphatidylinositol 4-phosphate 5-kinase 8 [Cynara cardunculus var. scolymus]XP_024979413.1 phosphatidylinositol 4-phosphate 5-kinase 8 [Cynara cardunculus var. scolymus]XP_024979414.1 phosphatidylinositol 4-phosphate 5-kinase 8 [Cynara cardunculus var. scolymus]
MSEEINLQGDVYFGNVKGKIPHGMGRYTWSDGTVYDGNWEDGKMTGRGQISWSSGTSYVGDFSGGYLHGIGTLTNPDGSVYNGSWRLNIQNGLGRKQYSTSDVYDGCWKDGVHEGSGKYAWSNGNMYIGNWKAGTMCGRGVMKWMNGDLFDGFWLNGYRHGSGVYRFADGSYYFGTWTKGLKDGQGTFYPAGSKCPPLKKFDKKKSLISHSSSGRSERFRDLERNVSRNYSQKISFNGFFRESGRILSMRLPPEEDYTIANSAIEFSTSENTNMLSHISDEGESDLDDDSSEVWEREYMQGVLMKERIKKNAGVPSKGKQQSKRQANDVKKRSCVDIYEGHKSYFLMLNLQLGIRYTVGKITPVPMREVRSSDFGERARIRMYFPRKGSQFTPPHYSVDFYWKDYCPMVFRNLREMFKLDAAEYMMSICGDDGLRELSSPGKSGSIFYLSHDDRFVIKTLRGSELKVLLKMLPSYYDHVNDYDNTLITKFFGLHEITLRGGKKVRFIVMGNMFKTELRIHRRYDLKGSYQGRFTNKDAIDEGTTLKDLDLAYDFHMDKSLREALFKQIHLDCLFLESQQIIDYSLLLGLHFRAPEHLKALLEPPDTMLMSSTPVDDGPTSSSGDLSIPPKGLLLVTHEPSSVNTAPGPHIRGNTLRAFSIGDKEVDLLLPGTARLRVQLGVNMPAQANRKVSEDVLGSADVELFEVYDVVLYLGIIDILQDYSMRKKVEHAYKSVRYDSASISVADPQFYSKRFVKFLEKVFPVDP